MGLFGQLSPETQAMLGGSLGAGMFQNAPQSIAPQVQMPQGMFGSAPTIKPPKPGFNDPGGWGEKLGRIGAILMASAGDDAGSRILQGQDETRLQALRHQQALDDYKAQSGAALQRELAVYQYKLDHPEQNDPAIAKSVEWLNAHYPGLGDQYARSFAQGPLQAVDVTNPDGSVVRQYMSKGPTAPSGPPVGTVVGGYQFKGGDPHDKNSWVPATGGASPAGSRTFP